MRKITLAALVALVLVASVASGALRRAVGDEESASVRMKQFAYHPMVIKVKRGTTITWTNDEDERHTVTADDGSFESPTLTKGKTFSRKFDKPGTVFYHCAFHGDDGMTGVIAVEQ